MIKDLTGNVMETSELVKAVAEVKKPKGKSVVLGDAVRKLKAKEIEKLIKNGNFSPDWDNILVAKEFSPDRVFHSSFFGNCVLGSFLENAVNVDKNLSYPSGIYNSTITDCEVGCNALVMNVGSISNYIIREDAVIFNCQSIVGSESAFGNGLEIGIAIETGGREVLSYAEMTIPVAELVAGRRADKQIQADYKAFIEKYVKAVTCPKGIICKKAIVRNTAKIANTFIGASALIDGATLVKEATILSNADEVTEVTDGAYVTQSILQWGSEATSMAIVAKSIMTEHSHAERHGKVTESILGPNTGVAEGECTASLCGPFVGFHHQSLLIAAYWPEGKGNVGYGANVGSNHTGKAPDQEIWCGEGTFFGLGVNIKMPTDLSRAPYCIIATAVNALPQKVEMPFSLINTPAALHPGISPAYNEIMPGWVLSDNIFSVKRNEGKYEKRNKAKRTKFTFEALRPDIIDLMLEARKRLSSVAQTKEIYTDKDVKGIGKNYLSEESRKNGIDAYTFYIKYYALKGLKAKVAELVSEKKAKEVAGILDTASACPRWEHERKVLLQEFSERDVKALLKQYADMTVQIAKDVEDSKAKDDKRGVRVIPDYAEAHEAAKDNSFVKQTWAETEATKKEIEELIKKLGN
ncbi:DUF4954 family protein [Candidatus Sumerlaeota bacterium]|nr:DUF4954 family protein [Candidatus Sumerlaeota bacterium]